MSKIDVAIFEEIVKNPNDVVVKNIFEYSDHLNVSASKLTKTLQGFGLEGFKELKFSIRCMSETSKVEHLNNIIIIVINLNTVIDEYKEKLINNKISYKEMFDEFYEYFCAIENCTESSLSRYYLNKLIEILNYLRLIGEEQEELYYLEFNSLMLNELNYLKQWINN